MEDIRSTLKASFLFKGLSEESLSRIFSSYTFKTLEYKRGELIFNNENAEKNLFFVLVGECEVLRKKSDGQSLILNVLKPGESFGILAVFDSEDEYPTEVVAGKSTRVLVIDKRQLLRLIRRYPRISQNVIGFLAKRISFLNRKIATFSSDSITEKLARFILTECEKEEKTSFNLNLKKCSEIIHAGRASVYRSLEQLQKMEIVSYENKIITVLDKDGLERIKK